MRIISQNRTSSWLLAVAPNRGKIVGESNYFTRFEKGVHIFWDHIGEFFVRDSGVVEENILDDVPILQYQAFRESTIRCVSYLYQGAVILHGGAIKYRNKVIAFLGHSGAGKSTAIDYFLQLGAELISEDELIFPKNEQSFLRGTGMLKLWVDDQDNGQRISPDLSKVIKAIDNCSLQEKYTPDVYIVLDVYQEEVLYQITAWQDKLAILAELQKGYAIFDKSAIHKNMPNLMSLTKVPMIISRRTMQTNRLENLKTIVKLAGTL